MSKWIRYDFENRLRKIMKKQHYKPNPNHHLGRPFLSSYQLAIEFDKLYHSDVESMGYVIGGKGVNERNSLSQYIGLQLSKEIKNGHISDIEGGFFSNTELKEVEFTKDIVSSATDGDYDLAIFSIKR